MIVLHDMTELRRLENLRRELVANVSHELKTPLAAIKGYAETLRLGAVNDSENNLHFVRRIEEQADRLHQLILDILQVARIESGEQVVELSNVPIATVIAECVEQFAEVAADWITKRTLLIDRDFGPIGLIDTFDQGKFGWVGANQILPIVNEASQRFSRLFFGHLRGSSQLRKIRRVASARRQIFNRQSYRAKG